MIVQEIINELNNSNIIPVVVTTFIVCYASYKLGRLQEYKASAIEILTMKDLFKNQAQTLKAEAIKEFAENIKLEFYKEFDEIIPSIMADKIDNLVKEMEGDDK